jgi:hypothetical protein
MADQIVFSSPETGPDAPPANQQQQQQTGERPAWLPENFKSPEDFRKSFDDTRAELTKLQQEKAEAAKKAGEQKPADEKKAEEKPTEKKEGEEGKKSPADITEKDVEQYSNELAETGEISEKSRAEIKELFNAPDWVIDTYIAGVKAQNEAANSAIVNAFGGDEAQNAIMAWAGTSLSDTEMETLNKQFDSRDMGTILFAIDALKGKYEAANGKSPANRLSGKANGVNTGTYASWDQVNKDMADPRYKSDPAFRAEVKEKLRGFNG